jgi:hypothetical protein
MNTDTWSAGPTAAGIAVPPRPDLTLPSWTAPTFRKGSYDASQWWQRFLAATGVVFAFFFLLTIPGWVALSRYRRWKRGDQPNAYGLMVWGALVSGVFVVGMLSAVIAPPS